jgi:hypothetical protein
MNLEVDDYIRVGAIEFDSSTGAVLVYGGKYYGCDPTDISDCKNMNQIIIEKVG